MFVSFSDVNNEGPLRDIFLLLNKNSVDFILPASSQYLMRNQRATISSGKFTYQQVFVLNDLTKCRK